MGTNFYWKTLPNEFKQYITEPLDNTNICLHIGKRSLAGSYCIDCGTTLCIDGTREIHEYNSQWLKCCPCCKKSLHDPHSPIIKCSSFSWTLMKHKQIIENHLNDPEYIIVDEYNNEYTCEQFLNDELRNVYINTQIAAEFS